MNSAIRRILYGHPLGHKHSRLVVELKDGRRLVFSEATVANIVRAYISVVTHPTHTAVELVAACPPLRKEGFAEHQLLEARYDDEVSEEIKRIIDNCTLIRGSF